MEHAQDIAPADLPWASATNWYIATLEAAHVAEILGIAEGSVRQYAAKPDMSPGFPQPAVRATGRPSLWTPDQIFRYILDARPQCADRIPRLYCPADTKPAQFMYAESRYIERLSPAMGQAVAEFAIHVWNPSDHRGLIAVAYPGQLEGQPWGYAAALLADLPESITAVALVTDDVSMRHDGWQTALGVAERGRPALDERQIQNQIPARDGRAPVVEMGWDYLANLLRVDIPWWGPLLRDMQAMCAWRPGTPRQKVRPRDAFLSPANFDRLVTAVPAANVEFVRDLTQRMHRLLEGDHIWVLPVGDQERPGLVQAAEPLHVLPHMPLTPTKGEYRALLHVPVADQSIAEQACQALRNVPGMDDVIATIARIDLADHGPLAAEWLQQLSKLGPVTGIEANELGFTYIRYNALGSGATNIQYYRQPRNRHGWTVVIDHPEFGKQIYIALATQVDAVGVLTELELNGTTAFFRDSEGHIWPMPAVSTNSGYSSGYDGTGPRDLFRAVRALTTDAATDLRHSPRPPLEHDPLWNRIHTTKAPLTITESDLASMQPPAP